MTIEIRELRSRWQTHRQALMRADFNYADEALAQVLYFAESTPIIRELIQSLRQLPAYNEFDIDAWLKRGSGSRRSNLGFSFEESDRTAQCLKVLEWAVNQFNLGTYGLASIGETTYIGSSSKFIDYIHSTIDVIFEPFYLYIDQSLRNMETMITPLDIMSEIQSLVDNQSDSKYPNTKKHLSDVYHDLFATKSSASEEAWKKIGYSCRDVLITFSNEIFDLSHVPQGVLQPKFDDVINKLKFTIRHFLKLSSAGDRYIDCVDGIIKANWDFVNNIGHRKGTTQTDAKLAVIYTYLTIMLIDSIRVENI